MYKKIFCILLCIGLILSSCNNYEKNEEKEISNYYEDELNIMHIEADNPDFKNYINDVSRKLNMISLLQSKKATSKIRFSDFTCGMFYK